MKCEARLKKMANKGEEVEYRCLVRATDGKKNISTAVLITVSLAIFHCN
jgi:signal recognition particle subunit SRP14